MSRANSLPWWDDRSTFSASIVRDTAKEKELDVPAIFETPRSIYDYLDSRLFGCHEYKKAISTAIWSSLHLKTKTNFLVIGPSGCGKTELARILSDVYYNMVIFDATSASPVSYKGCVTMSQCLLEIDNGENALPPWIFIDEVDKALLKGEECGTMLMNELLKMTEGGKLYVGKDEKERVLVDTSRVNFVFMGTFSALKKERRPSFGFTSDTACTAPSAPVTRDMLHQTQLLSDEFLGRINGGILEVEPMNETKAAALLADERYSPITRLEEKYRIKINLSDTKRKELISMTSRYGVRGIYSELQNRINDMIFEDCTAKTLTI